MSHYLPEDEGRFRKRWERVSHGHYLERPEGTERLPASQKLRETLFILKEVHGEDEFHAEHDILYLPITTESCEKLTDEQIVRLSQLGVHYNSDGDCLAMFC